MVVVLVKRVLVDVAQRYIILVGFDVEGYESRPIDLDILYYDDMIINDDDLILPHPRLHKRRFALMPLCDIAADFIHPVFKRSNRELLNECEDISEVKLYK